MTKEEFTFTPQPIADEDKVGLEALRATFITTAEVVAKALPEGRYKSVVMTKLEEAAMFATKALSHKGQPKA